MANLSPIVSEFETDEQAASYDRWFRPVAEHPYLYRSGRAPGTRELVAHPNYVLVYRVTLKRIEVVNIIHARQEYPT